MKLVPVLATLLSVSAASATDNAFKPTTPGTLEVKTLPACRIIETKSDGPYFAKNNNMFMSLFRYIDSNKIEMTAPVEAKVETTSAMRFYLGAGTEGKTYANTDKVTVLDLPERVVVAYGQRGSYTEPRFVIGSDKVKTWLKENPDYEATGEPYAVYWDGPFKPGLMKTSEVHLPLRKKPVTPPPAPAK